MRTRERRTARLVVVATALWSFILGASTAMAQARAQPGLPVKIPVGASAALKEIQARISRYVAAHPTHPSFASYIDHTTGRIILETDAPASLVSRLTDLSIATSSMPKATSSVLKAAGQIEVRHATVIPLYNRRDDAPPFDGGAGITDNDHHPRWCSTGYTVTDSDGTHFMTTAGHCFPSGVTVRTEDGGMQLTVGIVSHRHTADMDGLDIELIGGESYNPHMYVGGVTSKMRYTVVGAGYAVVAYNDYCISGTVSGEVCGLTALDVDGQACFENGPCLEPVIAYVGAQLGEGGDSGAPFYAKAPLPGNTGEYYVKIRGSVSARTNRTGYAMPWSAVASALDVNIDVPEWCHTPTGDACAYITALDEYLIFVNQARSRCLDADTNTIGRDGTKVQLWDCHGGLNQQWYRDGRQIKNRASGRCLDADTNTIGNNGTVVHLWSCHGGTNQWWTHDYWDRDQIKNWYSDRCLDADTNTIEDNGTRIQLWDWWGGDNQQWTIFRVIQ
jgi:hypothetical protein